jgi:pimeloyl-ACP methyl ester carboxylesterase
MSGDVAIAYQIVSDGPFDVVWVPGAVSNVELNWQDERWAAFIGRIASFCRLVIFDKRGTGLSDRGAGVPDLETRMDDVRAVLVSQTVKDLVAGSGLAFEEHGTAELKGVPGEWRLYAVADAAA